MWHRGFKGSGTNSGAAGYVSPWDRLDSNAESPRRASAGDLPAAAGRDDPGDDCATAGWRRHVACSGAARDGLGRCGVAALRRCGGAAVRRV